MSRLFVLVFSTFLAQITQTRRVLRLQCSMQMITRIEPDSITRWKFNRILYFSIARLMNRFNLLSTFVPQTLFSIGQH